MVERIEWSVSLVLLQVLKYDMTIKQQINGMLKSGVSNSASERPSSFKVYKTPAWNYSYTKEQKDGLPEV